MLLLNRILVLSLLVTLLACQAPLLPEQVAEKFWSAVKTQDKAGIKQYSTLFWNEEMLDLEELPDFETIELGTITINQNRADIDTTMHLIGQTKSHILFKTYLLNTDGVWKVDYKKTMEVAKPKEFTDSIKELSELGEALSDELNRSLDELNEAIPKIEEEISEFEKKIEEELPEFEQKINELIEKLKQLFSAPGQTEQQESETTEI